MCTGPGSGLNSYFFIAAYARFIRVRAGFGLKNVRSMANTTVNDYNANAKQFFADTVGVDMSDLHARFLSGLPKSGLILDAGCGSGRDSKAFLDRGFRVNSFDASSELALLATELTGQHVAIRTFAQVDEIA